MEVIKRKLFQEIMTTPGDLSYIPPAVLREAVSRTLDELVELLGDDTPYTINDLTGCEWVICEDGTACPEGFAYMDGDGCYYTEECDFEEHVAAEAEEASK